MKSSEIKNWRYELSYKEKTELDDFEDLLADAVSEQCCIECGGNRIISSGVCLGCSFDLEGENKEAETKIFNKHK